ncbi:uncharacterized protein LOC120837883 [Ixodes scapularis]|uniref:uncharacterized protein LOC120837883 n=1 Tax=Ixodes scapularis TaxID=6945 RepID=UPI001A9E1299|nr:uncharacterized protein LOC120837883 [Ixodes scapularis]
MPADKGGVVYVQSYRKKLPADSRNSKEPPPPKPPGNHHLKFFWGIKPPRGYIPAFRPPFGKNSRKKLLGTLHPDIQYTFATMVKVTTGRLAKSSPRMGHG